MIPMHWTTTARIPNLDRIVDAYRREGGTIVEYRSVMGAVAYTQVTPKIEWVPPGRSRVTAGLRHTISSALLGWWSLHGFFMTIGALIMNLMGGIDVTAVVLRRPGESIDESALRQLERERKRQGTVIAVVLLAIMVAAFVFMALPALRDG